MGRMVVGASEAVYAVAGCSRRRQLFNLCYLPTRYLPHWLHPRPVLLYATAVLPPRSRQLNTRYISVGARRGFDHRSLSRMPAESTCRACSCTCHAAPAHRNGLPWPEAWLLRTIRQTETLSVTVDCQHTQVARCRFRALHNWNPLRVARRRVRSSRCCARVERPCPCLQVTRLTETASKHRGLGSIPSAPWDRPRYECQRLSHLVCSKLQEKHVQAVSA